jgi:hypothetical protein
VPSTRGTPASHAAPGHKGRRSSTERGVSRAATGLDRRCATPLARASRAVRMLTSSTSPFPLVGEGRAPHSEATTWLGKIRVFLRKHGWVPEDERQVDEVDADEA